MKQEKTEWFLYDKRYLTDPSRATCFEVCDTLKEARKSAKDYDCVIVECQIEDCVIVSSKII